MPELMDKKTLRDLLAKHCEYQENPYGYIVPGELFIEILRVLQSDMEGTKIGILPCGFYSHEYYCGNCRKQVNLNDKFCHECGKLLKWPERRDNADQ